MTDKIITRPATDAFRDGYERIFSKNRRASDGNDGIAAKHEAIHQFDRAIIASSFRRAGVTI